MGTKLYQEPYDNEDDIRQSEGSAATGGELVSIGSTTANQLEGRANGAWGALSGAGSAGESEESTSVAFVLS